MSEELMYKELAGFKSIRDDRLLLDEGYMGFVACTMQGTAHFMYRVLKPFTINDCNMKPGERLVIKGNGSIIRLGKNNE